MALKLDSEIVITNQNFDNFHSESISDQENDVIVLILDANKWCRISAGLVFEITEYDKSSTKPGYVKLLDGAQCDIFCQSNSAIIKIWRHPNLSELLGFINNEGQKIQLGPFHQTNSIKNTTRIINFNHKSNFQDKLQDKHAEASNSPTFHSLEILGKSYNISIVDLRPSVMEALSKTRDWEQVYSSEFTVNDCLVHFSEPFVQSIEFVDLTALLPKGSQIESYICRTEFENGKPGSSIFLSDGSSFVLPFTNKNDVFILEALGSVFIIIPATPSGKAMTVNTSTKIFINENVPISGYFVDNTIYPVAPSRNFFQEIRWAIHNSNPTQVKELIEEDRLNIQHNPNESHFCRKSKKLNTVFHILANYRKKGTDEIAEMLITYLASMNCLLEMLTAVNIMGETPLHLSIIHNSTNVFSRLIFALGDKLGSVLQIRSNDGNCILELYRQELGYRPDLITGIGNVLTKTAFKNSVKDVSTPLDADKICEPYIAQGHSEYLLKTIRIACIVINNVRALNIKTATHPSVNGQNEESYIALKNKIKKIEEQLPEVSTKADLDARLESVFKNLIGNSRAFTIACTHFLIENYPEIHFDYCELQRGDNTFLILNPNTKDAVVCDAMFGKVFLYTEIGKKLLDYKQVPLSNPKYPNSYFGNSLVLFNPKYDEVVVKFSYPAIMPSYNVTHKHGH